MIVTALAMTSFFAQANETTNQKTTTTDAVKQVPEKVSTQDDTDKPTADETEKKVDGKATAQH